VSISQAPLAFDYEIHLISLRPETSNPVISQFIPHAFHIDDLYLFGCHFSLFNYLHMYPEGRLFLPQDPEFLFDKEQAQITSELNNCDVSLLSPRTLGT
jgi:hypothetical protein